MEFFLKLMSVCILQSLKGLFKKILDFLWLNNLKKFVFMRGWVKVWRTFIGDFYFTLGLKVKVFKINIIKNYEVHTKLYTKRNYYILSLLQLFYWILLKSTIRSYNGLISLFRLYITFNRNRLLNLYIKTQKSI